MSSRHKAYPPQLRNLSVPIQDRRSAHAGMAMYSPCRRLAVFVHAVSWLMVNISPKLLPGKTIDSGFPRDICEFLETLSRDLGEIDNFAAYRPRQTERSGAALLLLRHGVPVSFVKIRRDGADSLERERQATTLVASNVQTFRTPRSVAWGKIDAWSYVAYEPIPTGRHRVPRNPHLGAIAEDIIGALGVLPKPPNVPSHWTPMHGDFTPWNLRHHPIWGLVLVDWENVDWAPPGADEAFYLATMRALGKRVQYVPAQMEAREFWLERVTRRPHGTDSAFSVALIKALSPELEA